MFELVYSLHESPNPTPLAHVGSSTSAVCRPNGAVLLHNKARCRHEALTTGRRACHGSLLLREQSPWPLPGSHVRIAHGRLVHVSMYATQGGWVRYMRDMTTVSRSVVPNSLCSLGAQHCSPKS